MKTVTAKQLKNNTGEVLKRVRAGETITVTVRGVHVARVVPLKRGTHPEALREAQKSIRATVRSIGGKYRGLGTVEEFLEEKAREIAAER